MDEAIRLSGEVIRQQAVVDGLRVVRQCLHDNTPDSPERGSVLKAINAAILRADEKLHKANDELVAIVGE